MYQLRECQERDYDGCKTIGHEGLRPYIEKLIGWDQERENEGFRAHWQTEKIKIIQCDGADVGYINVENHASHLYIDGIYISRDWRSRGLGNAVLADLVSASSLPVRLQVYKINPAHLLYRRLGFEVINTCELRYYMEHKKSSSF